MTTPDLVLRLVRDISISPARCLKGWTVLEREGAEAGWGAALAQPVALLQAPTEEALHR